jgi:hypothetical protein
MGMPGRPSKVIAKNMDTYKSDMKEYFRLFDKYNIRNFKGSYFNADGTSKIKNYYGFIPKGDIKDKYSYPSRFLSINSSLEGGSNYNKNINLSIFKKNMENKIEYGNEFMYPIDTFEKTSTESEYKNDLINVINKINYIFDKTTEDLTKDKVPLKPKSIKVKNLEQQLLNKEQLQALIKILSLTNEIRSFLQQELSDLITYENYKILIDKYTQEDIQIALQFLSKDEINKLKDILTKNQLPTNLLELPRAIKMTAGSNSTKDKYIKYKTKYLRLKKIKKINMT